eukprot:Gb_38556 [translate_table: standard]
MLVKTTVVGAVPPRFRWVKGKIGFITHFSMASGNAKMPPMEMTKWFDTNYHYILPEVDPEVKFLYPSHKAVYEYKEAKEVSSMLPFILLNFIHLNLPGVVLPPPYHVNTTNGESVPQLLEVVSELNAAGPTGV